MSLQKIDVKRKQKNLDFGLKISISAEDDVLPSLQKNDVLMDIQMAEIYPLPNIFECVNVDTVPSDLVESEAEVKDDEQPTVLSLPGDEFYEIQPGDTLSEISAKFRVDMTQLCVWNNIMDPDLIFAGDKIRIK
jgi:LysM repeat protein